jgi:hypothetical protein
LGEHQSPSRVDVIVRPAFTNLTKIFDAMIKTKVFEKRRGCLVKNPALAGEKSDALSFILFNNSKK